LRGRHGPTGRTTRPPDVVPRRLPRVCCRGIDRGSVDEDLLRVINRLYGGTSRAATVVVGGHRAEESSAETFLAVPNATHPRFLLPGADRRSMARTLSTYNALRRGRTRLLRRLLAVAFHTGIGGRVLGEPIYIEVGSASGRHQPSLAAHLRSELGWSDALMALGVRPVDDHYKPTIQIFDRRGKPLGFAKAGWTAQTARMVRREVAALRHWEIEGPSRSLAVPRLLLAHEWDGLPFLVMEPLPTSVRAVSEKDPLSSIAAELTGSRVTAAITASPYWPSTSSRLSRLRQNLGGHLLSVVERVLAQVCGASDDRHWSFGRWHGDWTSWNVARDGDRIVAWDWEHSTDWAPWGFDVLHWLVTVPFIRGRASYGEAVAAALESEHVPRDGPPATHLMAAYLAEMGLRSLESGQPSARMADSHLYPGLAHQLQQMAARLG
jgi:hypothetical protein